MWHRDLKTKLWLCALLLTLPLAANAADFCKVDGEDIELQQDETCLTWFNAEDGERKAIVFNTNIDKAICQANQMTCFVEKDGGIPLEDCYGKISPENVDYDSGFGVKGNLAERVECFNKDGKIQKIDSDNKEGWSCHLVRANNIWKKWDGSPLLGDEAVNPNNPSSAQKANPWNGSEAYCPDPSPEGAINAYKISTGVTTPKTAPEIVQRYLLQACSKVIKYHQFACEEAAAEIVETRKRQARDARTQAEALGEEDPTTIIEEYETEVAIAEQERQKIMEIVNFLDKRYQNLQLHNVLSETQTYNVTNLLRRSEESTETQLVLFGADEPEGGKINIIDKVIRLIAQVLGSLGVLLLIISAVIMIVAQGEETMLQKAKQTFIYTLVGLAVAFMSYTIVRFVIELLLSR